MVIRLITVTLMYTAPVHLSVVTIPPTGRLFLEWKKKVLRSKHLENHLGERMGW